MRVVLSQAGTIRGQPFVEGFADVRDEMPLRVTLGFGLEGTNFHIRFQPGEDAGEHLDSLRDLTLDTPLLGLFAFRLHVIEAFYVIQAVVALGLESLSVFAGEKVLPVVRT